MPAPKRNKITASDLHIDLPSHSEPEYFKWFLACLLFGKPVQQSVARRAYTELVETEHIDTPQAVLDAGWDRLVEILDRAHYVRYDYSTATKLLDCAGKLRDEYEGKVGGVFERAAGEEGSIKRREEVGRELLGFKGVGPKTVEIFMRDMAPVLAGSGSLEREEEEEEEQEGEQSDDR
jgi:endonuclease III